MIDLIRYSIPFRQPFHGAGFKMTLRDGLLIRFENDDITAWAEASPLPGFSKSLIETCIARFRKLNEQLQDMILNQDDEQWTRWLRLSVPEPELRFAFDTLRTDYYSRFQGLPFHIYLNKNAPDVAQVNAVIGLLPPNETLQRGLSLLDSGYTTLKIKIYDPQPYLTVFQTLKNHPSKPRLRFDANGSWSAENGHDRANILSLTHPEYLEQPYPQGCEADHAALQATVGFPLALDESVATEGAALDAIEKGSTQVLILKPALIGNFQSLRTILQKAHEQKIHCTLTTLLDTGIARRAVASLAMAFADVQKAHGLSTGSLLSADPLPDILAAPGRFELCRAPGLGNPICDDTFSWEHL